jgi:hypothetical protein
MISEIGEKRVRAVGRVDRQRASLEKAKRQGSRRAI